MVAWEASIWKLIKFNGFKNLQKRRVHETRQRYFQALLKLLHRELSKISVHSKDSWLPVSLLSTRRKLLDVSVAWQLEIFFKHDSEPLLRWTSFRKFYLINLGIDWIPSGFSNFSALLLTVTSLYLHKPEALEAKHRWVEYYENTANGDGWESQLQTK